MAHTITGDNGKEFAGHESIAKQLDINFYFAHPYHSWERGANENTNGLIRQYIPKGTDFENGTQKQLDDVQYKLNNRPRKRLGFHSPREFSFIKFVKSKHKQKVTFEARIQQIKSLKMNKTSKIINVFSQSTYRKINSSKHIGKTRFVITFLMISFISISIFAQENKDTLRVLFVGNSYTHVNNLPQITSIVSESINTKLITRESTLGGARLREHWFGLRGLKTKEKIKNGSFDIVVLQGYSMSTIDFPDSLKKYSKLFCDYIRENGAEPYFYLTWARKKVPQYQETIDSVYYSIAKENNATVIPAGKAWALAQKLRSDIELFQIDGSHPSKFGTLLTATVFVATITNEVPQKIRRGYMIKDSNGEPVMLMYFYDQELLDLTFLKEIVKEIVVNEKKQ